MYTISYLLWTGRKIGKNSKTTSDNAQKGNQMLYVTNTRIPNQTIAIERTATQRGIIYAANAQEGDRIVCRHTRDGRNTFSRNVVLMHGELRLTPKQDIDSERDNR